MIGLSRIGLQVVRRSGSTSHLLHPGERRQGTSIIVHIDDTAISRPKPCVPPSYSTCFRAETRVHFCFLIISYTRAFDPKTPTVSPCSGTAYSFCALMLRSSHNTSGRHTIIKTHTSSCPQLECACTDGSRKRSNKPLGVGDLLYNR
jgi:hypothetical protein